MTKVHNYAVIKHLLNVYRVSGIEDAEMNCWSQVAHRILNKCINEQVNKHLGICTGAEPEIKLPTSAGSLKKQESSRKTSISALLTTPKPLTVWITIYCGKSERHGNTRPPDLPLEKPICRSGSNSQNWTWNNRLVPNRKRSTSWLYIVTLLI